MAHTDTHNLPHYQHHSPEGNILAGFFFFFFLTMRKQCLATHECLCFLKLILKVACCILKARRNFSDCLIGAPPLTEGGKGR